MEKKYKLLYHIHKYGFENQRSLASAVGLSVGLVNARLRQLNQEELLTKEGKKYQLTVKGELYLEQRLGESQKEKLLLPGGKSGIKEAVILAAGENDAFSGPVGLLPIGGMPLTEHILCYLQEFGIEKVCMVTGYEEELYFQYFKKRNLQFRSNPRYHWTGTMASLAAAADFVTGDFLLIESNQIFESEAIGKLLENPADNAMLLVNPSGSMDEAYVELDEQGNIFRISKDIRQMNSIDGELIGVSKISYAMFQKMQAYYRRNENPLLNYEYVLESLGRTYQISAVKADDLLLTVVENEEHYKKAAKRIYPRIQKRESLRRENRAREIFGACMGLESEDLEEFRVCGGMTNTNFYVKASGREYILRIPGAGTDEMIDRSKEESNSQLASKLGLTIPSLYFDTRTGVKIAPYIPQAETLNPRTARWEGNMRKTAEILRRLHNSKVSIKNYFSVAEEYEKYKVQAEAAHGKNYPGFKEMDAWFYEIMERLGAMGTTFCTCHNDLVAENLIKDGTGRMYLIDWEYSGMNDPMWDLASHLIECEFSREEEELFLQYYFGKEVPEGERERIFLYKMCQDILWSIWTVLKEAKGENFGTYGIDRLKRAQRGKEEYRKKYEKNS